MISLRDTAGEEMEQLFRRCTDGGGGGGGGGDIRIELGHGRARRPKRGWFVGLARSFKINRHFFFDREASSAFI